MESPTGGYYTDGFAVMVEKRMAQSKSCDDCGLGCHCGKAYEKLGCAEGPPITREVTVAFLLPILVFVAFLVVFGWLLQGVAPKPYQTVLAAAIALAATVGLMLALRALTRRHRTK